MIYAFWIDFVLLAVWLLLYCAEELRLAGRRWDWAVVGCFKRWALNAAKDHVVYDGELKNYMVQSAQAAERGRQQVQSLLDAGWIETMPGILESPDGKSTVML